MLVKFLLIDQIGEIVRYKYSRETLDLDGVISYDIKNGRGQIDTPSKADSGDDRNQKSTLQILRDCIIPHMYKARTIMT